MTKQVPLYIKMWKTSKNEVTYNSWNQIQDKEKTWKFTKSLREKGFRIQDFWINHFILNLIPRVSSLYDTFDDNEGLLHSHFYWKNERPGDIKLPDRQFLIPNENKKHGFVKGQRFCSYLLKFLKKARATSEDYWELEATTSQEFRDLISKWFVRKRHVLSIYKYNDTE